MENIPAGMTGADSWPALQRERKIVRVDMFVKWTWNLLYLKRQEHTPLLRLSMYAVFHPSCESCISWYASRWKGIHHESCLPWIETFLILMLCSHAPPFWCYFRWTGDFQWIGRFQSVGSSEQALISGESHKKFTYIREFDGKWQEFLSFFFSQICYVAHHLWISLIHG